jgi:pimeloyl-ACP methyl ester carboxylesterase
MPEVTNGDVTIFFEDEGDGTAVLLIHGHTLDRRIWNPVMPGLLDARLRVVRPDLRGHGESSRPDFGYHFIHHAADMAAVLDAVGLERALVVGYSVGGGVALELAITMPERVAGLVLVSPVMPDRPFDPEFMDNLKAVARAIRADGVEAAMMGPWASSPLFEFSFTRPGVRERAAEITRDFPGAEYLATQRDDVRRTWKVPDRLSGIDLPTMVVAGANEMPGFIAFAEEAAAGIPGAVLELFENCGHLVPLEEPERLAAAIISVAGKVSV